ncbi:MAG TPA: hypothetical protein VGN65_09040 [Casimicrobiaceae bacterium]
MIACSVGQRARAIGVRVALGAESADVVRIVLGREFAPAGMRAIVGLAEWIVPRHDRLGRRCSA